ncbi:hypothetical protein J6590_010263 [Homalodisca vitripennis]|nr:hypothetical protein J6590_010263 [Homalodisca vitripennis]
MTTLVISSQLTANKAKSEASAVEASRKKIGNRELSEAEARAVRARVRGIGVSDACVLSPSRQTSRTNSDTS